METTTIVVTAATSGHRLKEDIFMPLLSVLLFIKPMPLSRDQNQIGIEQLNIPLHCCLGVSSDVKEGGRSVELIKTILC